ncbi:DNA replication complex GINS protein PSF3-like protein [Dinothrombium tinctorium]|uniref:DNA replication complex GINS protein PSF3 n=1 Tax=Dinothrombium tinctorium TaxID=1965070 RepID=A0A3S3S7W1_9ACAR|nr:DNA replication complex GINS protein PSF3-like protein [Dinothrombium tinctorium]RWS10408.1 DNA replication complex GINS protein PSF3-like protein [Dinothrombium tinctorium]RWS11432.1 DNA replication complex GINS protein PSF3-like protein [Dinothrombium tinctorium]
MAASGANGGRVPSDFAAIDDIVALSKKVSCRFVKSVARLGFIDQSADCEHVAEGTQLELPLWMAKTLAARGLITVDPPKGYNQIYREILDADASVVDLHKLGPHFYAFGGHLVAMNAPEGEEIAKSLVHTFHQRLHKIMDFSLNASEDTPFELHAFKNNLDSCELELFEEGSNCLKDVKKWEHRTLDQICANDMVVSLKKRKRAMMACSERMATDS